MPEQKRHLFRHWDFWGLGAVIVALLVCAPIFAIFMFALQPNDDIWQHLVSTTLPRYFANTVFMMIAVSVLAGSMGVVSAYLVTHFVFPGRTWLQWALFLPIAVPAYVSAFVLADFMDYSGPLQQSLRAIFGWQNAGDYWFPKFRSRWGAAFVLSFALFPYVYVLARSAFMMQSESFFDAARTLGRSEWQRFAGIALPLARPAIVAGLAITMMETLSDFGTVDVFAVQTLTTGIFTVWFQAGDLAGAAQISVLILGIVILIAMTERLSRTRGKLAGNARGFRPLRRQPLSLVGRWIATLACGVPFAMGFLLPVSLLSWHGLPVMANMPGRLLSAIANSATMGALSVIFISVGAILVVIGAYRSRVAWVRKLLPLTNLGYAAPGAVLAVGLLFPLSHIEHGLADFILATTGYDPGLLITGSMAALLLAYFIRFFAIGSGGVENAYLAIPPQLESAARTLGDTRNTVVRRITVPLAARSLGAASVLIFVDVIKELPATLILRPFGFDTLASYVFESASLEQIQEASAGGLLIVVIALVAVFVLARLNREVDPDASQNFSKKRLAKAPVKP